MRWRRKSERNSTYVNRTIFLRASAALVMISALIVLSCCRSASGLSKKEMSGNCLTAKMELTIPTRDAFYSVSGTLKASRGQMVQISLLMPILRTEVARLEATPDDVLLLDRMNHRFSRTSNSPLGRSLPIKSLFQRLDTELFKAAQTKESLTLTPSDLGLAGLDKGKVELYDFSFGDFELTPTEFSLSRYKEVQLEELLQLLMSL